MREEGERRSFGDKVKLLFEDLSFAQVAAGALAAVTSMLFASQIGIAGSVIGAAVGSVVSAVSSQVYKKFISASAEKIKVIPAVANAASSPPSRSDDDARSADSDDGSGESCAGARCDDVAFASFGEADARAYSNPDLYRARAVERLRVQRRRRVVLVAIVSSVAAVLASALLVYVLTSGEGIGTKPESVWSPASIERASSQASVSDGAKVGGALSRGASSGQEGASSFSSNTAAGTVESAAPSSSDSTTSTSAAPSASSSASSSASPSSSASSSSSSSASSAENAAG